MRIIAIGLGGAGCRIVDQLYATDRRSSNVACVQALAIDVDEPTIKGLKGIPDKGRLFFPAFDVNLTGSESSHPHTATIDIGEIVSKVQNFETGEIDAIILCTGLGGSMTDIAPHIIAGLRSSVVEPIFGLVTLPCLAEGERRSSKAADDIDMLLPLLDGIVLFDNETWYKKIRADKAHLPVKEMGFAEKMGFAKKQQELSTVQATYTLLNEGIVKRISLILRAGEFKADGGIDLAEVVLDSGEVLNTMKGMGFITIGYAVERLPSDPFSFLSRLKPVGLKDEDQKKKASRIIELAKQAIYHEVSTPCDMTSAHKALVLIAGPSHELSMMGFMTVRKWIDRSIAGLETRSGDYPVMNTKNVAIIIMLSGLENIPRVTELMEIREQYRSHRGAEGSVRLDKISLPGKPSTHTGARDVGRPDSAKGAGRRDLRDEIIRLPEKQQPAQDFRTNAPEALLQDVTVPEAPENGHNEPAGAMPVSERKTIPVDGATDQPHRVQKRTILEETAPPPLHDRERGRVTIASPPSARTRIITSDNPKEESGKSLSSSLPNLPFRMNAIKKDGSVSHPGAPDSGARNPPKAKPEEEPVRSRETDRQKIERDLQRQRMRAITGHHTPQAPESQKFRVSGEEHLGTEHQQAGSHRVVGSPEGTRSPNSIGREDQKKVVLVSKKKVATPAFEEFPEESGQVSSETDSVEIDRKENDMETKGSPEHSLTLKDPAYKADDKVFEGKITRRVVQTPANDAGLIHTALKSRKAQSNPDTAEPKGDEGEESRQEETKKARGKTGKHDDISWV